jgi:hypothetical protein
MCYRRHSAANTKTPAQSSGRKILPGSLTDLATIGRNNNKMRVMRTMTVRFTVALTTVTGGICSEATLQQRPGLQHRRD